MCFPALEELLKATNLRILYHLDSHTSPFQGIPKSELQCSFAVSRFFSCSRLIRDIEESLEERMRCERVVGHRRHPRTDAYSRRPAMDITQKACNKLSTNNSFICPQICVYTQTGDLQQSGSFWKAGECVPVNSL
jgi:hypothetical protein